MLKHTAVPENIRRDIIKLHRQGECFKSIAKIVKIPADIVEFGYRHLTRQATQHEVNVSFNQNHRAVCACKYAKKKRGDYTKNQTVLEF